MNWLFYGFLAAWVIHLLYLFSITSRQRQIGNEIETLQRMLEAGDGSRASSTSMR